VKIRRKEFRPIRMGEYYTVAEEDSLKKREKWERKDTGAIQLREDCKNPLLSSGGEGYVEKRQSTTG